MALAAQLKDEGNELFRQGNYLKAAAIYTKAIKEEPQNAVLYSNRAAALLKLNKLPKAWADAEQAMQLNPEWEKGYMRAAAVAEAQQRPEQALELYRSAQRVKPDCRELAGKVRSLSKSLGVASNGSNIGLISSAKAAAATATEEANTRKGFKFSKAGNGSSAAADTAAAAADQGQQKGTGKELWAGGRLPEAAERFQQQMLEYANTKVLTEGTGWPPEVHILSGEGVETSIRAAAAFKNPSAYMEFVTMLRDKTEELQAQAAVLLVPQAAVAFPQVWEKAGWPYQDVGGVLMQLQAPSQAALEGQQASNAAAASAAGTGSSSSGSSKYVKPAAGSSAPGATPSSSNAGADSPRQRSDQEARGSKTSSNGSKEAGANGFAASSNLCDRLWYLTDKGRDAWCIKEASCQFGILPQIIRTGARVPQNSAGLAC